MLVYFLRGSLPWQGIDGNTEAEVRRRTTEKKMGTSTEKLCRGLPSEFATFLDYTRNLKFDDKPDYTYCRQIFRDLFEKRGYKHDGIFPWNKPKPWEREKCERSSAKGLSANGPDTEAANHTRS